MTLTKAGIVQALIDSIGIPRSEAAEIVDAFFDELVSALASGSDVKLGLGAFDCAQNRLALAAIRGQANG